MARRTAPAPSPALEQDTRTRILAAACDEFGAHGFDATSVDRIARGARVNKAMIYYHFPNKRALYTSVIRDIFAPITVRVGAAMLEDGPPGRKLDLVIEALTRSIDESSYFLPIFLREIADGGAHLGPEELGLIAGIFAAVRGVISDGVEQKIFRPVHPALAHFTIIAPLVMFRAAAPVRARIKAVRHVDIPDADSETLIRHLQMVARRMLEIEPLEGGESRVQQSTVEESAVQESTVEKTTVRRSRGRRAKVGLRNESRS